MGISGNNKTLSIVLKALGIIFTVGIIIVIIGTALGFWHTPKYNGSGHWLFVTLLVGINLWILGAIYDGKDNLNMAGKRVLAFYKAFFIIAVLLFFVDMFVFNPVISGLDLSLRELVNCLFGGLLGGGLSLLCDNKKYRQLTR